MKGGMMMVSVSGTAVKDYSEESLTPTLRLLFRYPCDSQAEIPVILANELERYYT